MEYRVVSHEVADGETGVRNMKDVSDYGPIVIVSLGRFKDSAIRSIFKS